MIIANIDCRCGRAVLSSVKLRSSLWPFSPADVIVSWKELWCTSGTQWFGTHVPLSGCCVLNHIISPGLTSAADVDEDDTDVVMVLFSLTDLVITSFTGKYTDSTGNCRTSAAATKALKLL